MALREKRTSRLLAPLSQVVSDMSFRILVPLAGARRRVVRGKVSCERAAPGTFNDFILPLCHMRRHRNRALSNTAAAGPIYVQMFYILL